MPPLDRLAGGTTRQAGGGPKGDGHEQFLDREGGEWVSLTRYDTLGKAAGDLQAGREVDYLFGDAMALHEGFLEDAPRAKAYEFVGPDMRDRSVFRRGIAVAVQKGKPSCATRLNRALAEIRAERHVRGESQRQYFEFAVHAWQ